jgi:hypothetical protein
VPKNSANLGSTGFRFNSLKARWGKGEGKERKERKRGEKKKGKGDRRG